MAGSFGVDLPVFAGPFRLLADLILEQKVDVCDVQVASITDRYLAHAKDTDAWNLEEATWFLAICAVLLELKVGRLMPRHTEPDDEDLLGPSPDLAYARSLELRAFRKVALEIARRLEDEAGYFARDIGPGPEFAHLYPDPMERLTPEQLAAVAVPLLRPPPMLDLSHVTPVRHTVAEAITTLETLMASFTGGASFRDLVADCEDRIHVVVRFLAILELYREGKVELQQAATFGEIEVEWTGGGEHGSGADARHARPRGAVLRLRRTHHGRRPGAGAGSGSADGRVPVRSAGERPRGARERPRVAEHRGRLAAVHASGRGAHRGAVRAVLPPGPPDEGRARDARHRGVQAP